MRSVNKRRAEILSDIMEGLSNQENTAVSIVSTLMKDCPSYQERVLCENECENDMKYFSTVKVHLEFKHDFSNLVEAIIKNYPSHPECSKCHKVEGNSMEITYGPLIVIEVNIFIIFADFQCNYDFH